MAFNNRIFLTFPALNINVSSSTGFIVFVCGLGFSLWFTTSLMESTPEQLEEYKNIDTWTTKIDKTITKFKYEHEDNEIIIYYLNDQAKLERTIVSPAVNVTRTINQDKYIFTRRVPKDNIQLNSIQKLILAHVNRTHATHDKIYKHIELR